MMKLTEEERRARRKARKLAWDRANQHKRAEYCRKRRAEFIAKGLNNRGLPRERQGRKPGPAIRDCARHNVQAPSVPCQSVEDFIARGGHVERLAGFAYQRPPVMPVSLARQGVRAA